MANTYTHHKWVSREKYYELKKKPILPYEGMKFADDYFMPHKLKNGKYHVYLTNICNMIKKSTPIESAFRSQKISTATYFNWKRIAKEEEEKYKDTEYTTPLIMFFDAVYDAESEGESNIAEVLVRTAIEDSNVDSAKYLLTRRYKWKDKTSVELDTSEDSSIEINITPMVDNYNEKDEE